MITSSHLTALRSSLPLVEARAGAIAVDFYARLFADRPELLRDQFNRGDQAQGRQQRELALTIVTLARDVVGTQVGAGAGRRGGAGSAPQDASGGTDSAPRDARGGAGSATPDASGGAGSAPRDASGGAGSAPRDTPQDTPQHAPRDASGGVGGVGAPGSGGVGPATTAAVPVAPWASPAPSPWAVRVAARETLSRLAQRHAAIGVVRDEYDVFERHLGDAFAAALGDGWPGVVADAWQALWRQTRDELVAGVERIYRAAALRPDEEWREAIVTERRVEAEDVVALTLVSADSEALPTYRAGQFASIQVTLPDGARQIRQYSLRGGSDEQWRVSARVLGGVPELGLPPGEVSTHLHQHVGVGDVVSVSPPIGSLTIDELDDSPLVFLSAGIGCTPVLGMLDHLVRTDPRRQVTVLHFERTPERHAHRTELEALVASMPEGRLRVSYTQGSLSAVTALADASLDGPGVYLDPIDLDTVDLTPQHRVFLCGPVPFMAIARSALIAHGVPASRVHHFVFGPDDGSVTGADTGQRGARGV